METGLQIYLQDWLKVRPHFSTEAEAIEAVKQNGYALQYVWSDFFEQ